MTKDEKLILDAAVLRNGKKVLTCSQAIRLSREYDIPLEKIGKTCNEHSVKIRECQLGCFK
jgi:hypothetical protein